MPDFIPSSDAEFDSWQINGLTYLNANLAALGLTAVESFIVAADYSRSQDTQHGVSMFSRGLHVFPLLKACMAPNCGRIRS